MLNELENGLKGNRNRTPLQRPTSFVWNVLLSCANKGNLTLHLRYELIQCYGVNMPMTLEKALITSAENGVKKHNITGAKAKRERCVLLHRVVNAVISIPPGHWLVAESVSTVILIRVQGGLRNRRRASNRQRVVCGPHIRRGAAGIALNAAALDFRQISGLPGKEPVWF